MEYHKMTWREFISRGMTAGWLNDEQVIWEDTPERERRKLEYRYSDKYKRTFKETLQIDLKVIGRVLRRRLIGVIDGRRRT